MRWRFKGKFSDRIGKDYKYECDNCGNRIKVEDILPDKNKPRLKHIPTKKLGSITHFWCPRCGEFERW